MKQDNTERIRARILELIESEFESDAAFERAMGLGDKTVNNWRRARSSSFMKILPRLAETFKARYGYDLKISSILLVYLVHIKRVLLIICLKKLLKSIRTLLNMMGNGIISLILNLKKH